MAHTASSYLADGPQAVFLLKAGDKETWYTDGERALRAWETLKNNGVHLYVGRTNKELKKIR